MLYAQKRVQALLAPAGVPINDNDNPDSIIVKDPKAYTEACKGPFGIGLAFMRGLWTAEVPNRPMEKVISQKLHEKFNTWWREIWLTLLSSVSNLQSLARATIVAEEHYDLGNEFYQAWLDSSMGYTAADWTSATTLDQAQIDKYRYIANELGVKPGDRILDIGCGWGGLAKFLAEERGADVVGITVSKPQIEYVKELCRDLCRGSVEVRFCDYRHMNEQFDHIVSVEMIEAVGKKNLAVYMEVVRRCLKPGGKFYLQVIVSDRSVNRTDKWTHTFIFPNGMLPSMMQLMKAIEGRLKVIAVQEVGHFYSRTLGEWRQRYKDAWQANPWMREKYEELFRAKWPKYAKEGATFERMWIYYLSYTMAAFDAGKNRLYRMTLVHDYDTVHHNT